MSAWQVFAAMAPDLVKSPLSKWIVAAILIAYLLPLGLVWYTGYKQLDKLVDISYEQKVAQVQTVQRLDELINRIESPEKRLAQHQHKETPL